MIDMEDSSIYAGDIMGNIQWRHPFQACRHGGNRSPVSIKLSASVMRGFSLNYGVEFDELTLSHVHSVEFINSMCVIRKAKPENNVLGSRLLGGKIPLVDDDVLYPKPQCVLADTVPVNQQSGVVKDEELELELTKIRQELLAVYASRSWRITKPLRNIIGLLKG